MVQFPRWKIVLVLFVCFGAILLALPNVLPSTWMKDSKKVNLGLDLQGGSYLLLEVGFDSYMKEHLDAALDDARLRLRKAKIGYKGLRVHNDALRFDLRNLDDEDKLSEVFKDWYQQMETEVNAVGAVELKYREETLEEFLKNVVSQSIEIVRRRVDETGTREPIIQRQGDNRILLQVPGLQDPERLKSLLGKTAKMSFHLMNEDDPYPVQKRPAPLGEMLLEGQSDKRLYMVKKRVLLSGDMLVNARPTFNEGQAVVSFRFNNLGGEKFGRITRENTGKPFAIVLDGKVISAPRINEPILGGSGIISGGFNSQTANDLALLLRAGALPAPLEIMEERTVGPSLGQDSIEAGAIASVIGIALILVFMFISYGLFGLFSNIALVMNVVLIVAALSFFQATLTLPGIAGIILTMGMAVDANVLIFERIREEMRIGKTPIAAIDHGFSQALKTILDSNITTLIATLLLFVFGSGPVKGFAVTLSIGILASMFSAIMLTRMMVVIWLRKTKPSSIPL
jgi:preprotein translocase subunit SecD